MNKEQIARARWCQNSPSTWILKARVKDGGAVLATITERCYPMNATAESSRYYGCYWEAGKKYGVTPWRYQAMRKVRAAVREVTP